MTSTSSGDSSVLRVPYVISSAYLDELVRAGAPAVAGFLGAQAAFIERAWFAEGNAALVAFAASSLLSQVDGRVPHCEALALLHVLEAQALLAAATHSDHAVRALAGADRVQDILSGLTPTATSFELLSESVLIAGVALKAVGRFDDSIDYLRAQRRDRRWSGVAAIALARQEVMMMFQDEDRHLLLLHEAPAYRDARPREYFRTVKRVTELLLNRQRLALADVLAPELGRAYVRAKSELSVLGRLSMMRDLAQLYAARGEHERGCGSCGCA